MISTSILNTLNAQVGHEKYNSNAYLLAAGWFCNMSLPGFAKFLMKGSEEENEHAIRFVNYILKQNGQLKLDDMQQPINLAGTPVEQFEEILQLEQKTTALINNLMKLAVAEGDFATQNMLMWFIDEQVASEYEIGKILEQLKIAGDNRAAVLFLDHEIGE